MKNTWSQEGQKELRKIGEALTRAVRETDALVEDAFRAPAHSGSQADRVQVTRGILRYAQKKLNGVVDHVQSMDAQAALDSSFTGWHHSPNKSGGLRRSLGLRKEQDQEILPTPCVWNPPALGSSAAAQKSIGNAERTEPENEVPFWDASSPKATDKPAAASGWPIPSPATGHLGTPESASCNKPQLPSACTAMSDGTADEAAGRPRPRESSEQQQLSSGSVSATVCRSWECDTAQIMAAALRDRVPRPFFGEALAGFDEVLQEFRALGSGQAPAGEAPVLGSPSIDGLRCMSSVLSSGSRAQPAEASPAGDASGEHARGCRDRLTMASPAGTRSRAHPMLEDCSSLASPAGTSSGVHPVHGNLKGPTGSWPGVQPVSGDWISIASPVSTQAALPSSQVHPVHGNLEGSVDSWSGVQPVSGDWSSIASQAAIRAAAHPLGKASSSVASPVGTRSETHRICRDWSPAGNQLAAGMQSGVHPVHRESNTKQEPPASYALDVAAGCLNTGASVIEGRQHSSVIDTVCFGNTKGQHSLRKQCRSDSTSGRWGGGGRSLTQHSSKAASRDVMSAQDAGLALLACSQDETCAGEPELAHGRCQSAPVRRAFNGCDIGNRISNSSGCGSAGKNSLGLICNPQAVIFDQSGRQELTSLRSCAEFVVKNMPMHADQDKHPVPVRRERNRWRRNRGMSPSSNATGNDSGSRAGNMDGADTESNKSSISSQTAVAFTNISHASGTGAGTSCGTENADGVICSEASGHPAAVMAAAEQLTDQEPLSSLARSNAEAMIAGAVDDKSSLQKHHWAGQSDAGESKGSGDWPVSERQLGCDRSEPRPKRLTYSFGEAELGPHEGIETSANDAACCNQEVHSYLQNTGENASEFHEDSPAITVEIEVANSVVEGSPIAAFERRSIGKVGVHRSLIMDEYNQGQPCSECSSNPCDWTSNNPDRHFSRQNSIVSISGYSECSAVSRCSCSQPSRRCSADGQTTADTSKEKAVNAEDCNAGGSYCAVEESSGTPEHVRSVKEMVNTLESEGAPALGMFFMGRMDSMGASGAAADVMGNALPAAAGSAFEGQGEQSENVMPLKERLEMLLKQRSNSESKETPAEPGRLQGADQDSSPLGLTQVVHLLQAGVASATSGDACPSVSSASNPAGAAPSGGEQGGSKGKGKGKCMPPPSAPKPKAPEPPPEHTSNKGKGKGKGAPKAPPKAPPKAGAKAKAGGSMPRTPRKAEVKPRTSMKRLFWSSFVLDEKLLATDRASVWRIIDEHGMNDFDINELEFMFGDRQSGASAHLFGSEDSLISKKRAQTRVRVLEETRRRQICVMLARLPAIPETIRAVTEMDDVRLNKDQVELLLANAPSAEELGALRSAAAEMEHDADESLNWDDAEAFILRLSAVPSFALRLQIWAFENSFDERFEVFQQAATDVREACLALRRCPCIQRLLALGLSVGNYLNAGTSRGRADGFTVDALSQMRTVKASQPGTGTLVDFIVRQAEQQSPGSLDTLFSDGGGAKLVRKAARQKLADLNVELTAYIAQAVGLVKRTASLQDDDELGVRSQRVEARLQDLYELQKLFGEADDEYQQLCAWFHEGQDRAPRPSDEFLSLWDGFLEAVRVALETLYSGRLRRRKTVAGLCTKPLEKLKLSLSVGESGVDDFQKSASASPSPTTEDDGEDSQHQLSPKVAGSRRRRTL